MLLVPTGVVSANKFKDRSASVNLTQALETSGINPIIPKELLALHTANPTASGPEALASLRNRIVHPKPSGLRGIVATPLAARVEAWELAMWYLDLLFLRGVGHSGHYGSRLTKGWSGQEVKEVPWGLHA